jgi:DNA-binding NarL/FixJ family response regulator
MNESVQRKNTFIPPPQLETRNLPQTIDIQLLILKARGGNDETIEKELDMRPSTITKHLSTVSRQLEATSYFDAVLKCLEQRIIIPQQLVPDRQVLAPFQTLSERNEEILHAMLTGRTTETKDIFQALPGYLAESTLNNKILAMLREVGADTRLQAVVMYTVYKMPPDQQEDANLPGTTVHRKTSPPEITPPEKTNPQRVLFSDITDEAIAPFLPGWLQSPRGLGMRTNLSLMDGEYENPLPILQRLREAAVIDVAESAFASNPFLMGGLTVYGILQQFARANTMDISLVTNSPVRNSDRRYSLIKVDMQEPLPILHASLHQVAQRYAEITAGQDNARKIEDDPRMNKRRTKKIRMMQCIKIHKKYVVDMLNLCKERGL